MLLMPSTATIRSSSTEELLATSEVLPWQQKQILVSIKLILGFKIIRFLIVIDLQHRTKCMKMVIYNL